MTKPHVTYTADDGDGDRYGALQDDDCVWFYVEGGAVWHCIRGTEVPMDVELELLALLAGCPEAIGKLDGESDFFSCPMCGCHGAHFCVTLHTEEGPTLEESISPRVHAEAQ